NLCPLERPCRRLAHPRADLLLELSQIVQRRDERAHLARQRDTVGRVEPEALELMLERIEPLLELLPCSPQCTLVFGVAGAYLHPIHTVAVTRRGALAPRQRG